MRCYQHIGLTQKAHKFLDKNVKRIPDICCPDCKRVITTKMDCKVYANEDLFYGDGPALHEYRLKDGRTAKEIVQCSPWSGGPMGFLCLKIKGRRKFCWTDNQIEEYG